MKTIQLGISDFAIPSPRIGSIDTYSGYGPLPNVGTQIHQDVQAERLREAPFYIAEKWLSHSFDHPDIKVTVGGRMDGYIPPGQIEEIKSAYDVPALIKVLSTQADHPYARQLRTYGYIHYLQTGTLPELKLILVCARTRKIDEFRVDLDAGEYEAWLKRRLTELAAEEKAFAALHSRRKMSVKNFSFPFPEARPGQIELMETVSEKLTKDARLLLQAPTGLGKTVGILYPALQEAYARGQKLIYLTAKNSQHEVAEDAAKRLQASGCKVRSLTLHAKAKMCFKDEPQCNPQACEFARDYYTKVSENKLGEKLAKKKNLSARAFEKLGRQYEVCPFELQLEAVSRADLVICDYNYVFSPHNVRGRLLQNGFSSKKSAPNLVIDEAHNLPARATDYFSARLDGRELLDLQLQADYLPASLEESFRKLIFQLRDLLDKYGGSGPTKVSLKHEDFIMLYGRAQELQSAYLSLGEPLRSKDPVLKACNLISEFVLRLESLDDHFFCTWTPGAGGGSLRITCCDASAWLRESYDHFASVIAFSATLKPFNYYTQLLGFDSEDLSTAEFQSPFPRSRRKILIIPQVSTKMRDRQSNYHKITEAIERLLQLRPGNYFAFFPSFDFMNQIAARVNVPGFHVITQTREMNRQAVDRVLDQLRAPEKPTIVFAVQGGVFAEGVDYPGDMLIGAFIVGPALPTFDFERELLREYYDQKHGHGFDYAYTYPAMARVVQSAGRVIRSHKDRGLIVLMDRRFTHEAYVKSMPADWVEPDPSQLLSDQILNDVRRFWEEHDVE